MDTKNNKRQETFKFFNRHYHIQDIKYAQHKNVNISWGYQRFPCHKVAAETLKSEKGIIFF